MTVIRGLLYLFILRAVSAILSQFTKFIYWDSDFGRYHFVYVGLHSFMKLRFRFVIMEILLLIVNPISWSWALKPKQVEKIKTIQTSVLV